MLKAIPFFASFITAIAVVAGIWLGGWYTFLTPLIVFVGLPIADVLAGQDATDVLPDRARSPLLENIVRLWAPVQLAVLGIALWTVSFGSLTALEVVGVLWSTALVSAGGAINAAHEMMHRKSRLDRALAEVLMTTVSYTHFCIEHVNGHHRYVGTPRDPATARLGQSVYAFYPQTVVGSLKSAIAIERKRNQHRGIGWFSWRNRLSRYAVVGVLSWAAVLAIFGPAGLLFHLAQGFLAFSQLEVINYVEHYGLMRREKARGRYEPIRSRHSWNANHRISNWWLFNLQRHADHHAQASRPYYNLRALDDGPQLPFSYPTALIVALVPPLWHAIMDHRAQAAGDGAIVHKSAAEGSAL